MCDVLEVAKYCFWGIEDWCSLNIDVGAYAPVDALEVTYDLLMENQRFDTA